MSVLAGLAVIFFGTSEGQDLTTAILVLALVAGLIVWHLTKPGNPSTS
ncbi:amidophosphoribosyltransferase [Micromonospora sp. NBC_01699]|nr:amidophosphoribosyltransferase [Micromonospora sp. NBC_01699]